MNEQLADEVAELEDVIRNELNDFSAKTGRQVHDIMVWKRYEDEDNVFYDVDVELAEKEEVESE